MNSKQNAKKLLLIMFMFLCQCCYKEILTEEG